MTPFEDPGWPNPLLVLVPGALQRWARRQTSARQLVTTRMVFLAFAMALVLYGFVSLFVVEESTAAIWPSLLAVDGAFGVAQVVGPLVEPSLDVSSENALATSWRKRFFTRVAFAESTALVAFVLVFVTAHKLIYGLGMVLGLVSLWRTAPRTTTLQAESQELMANGCPFDLLRVIAGSGAG